MQVYIVTRGPFPIGMAGSNRIKNYAKGIIESGISCKVIVAVRTESNICKNRLIKGVFEKVPFMYIPSTTKRSSNKILHRFYDLLDYFHTFFYCIKNLKSGDILFANTRGNFFRMLLFLACKLSDSKLVMELCEYPVGTSIESHFKKIKRWFELIFIFKIYDGFVSISETLFELACKHKKHKAKVIKIPILVEDVYKITKEEKVNNDYKIPYIFHSGTMLDQKDGILGVLKAFSLARKRISFPIKYVFTGKLSDSRDENEIKKIITANSLKKSIDFLGYISKEELLKYSVNSTLMIINKGDNLQNKYCFATKLGEYLLTGKPVITTAIGEAKKFLNNGKTAYIIEPGNVNQLAEKIIEIFNNPDASMAIGMQGREMALREFNYKIHGKRIINFFKSII